MKNKKFIFIPMSWGSSFKIWKDTGLINRETAYYKMINDKFCDIKFNTYNAGEDEVRLLKEYIPNGDIVYKKNAFWDKVKFGDLVSSFISPILNISKFKGFILVRSNQTSGAISGLIVAKWKKIPFVLRSGYLLSEFSKKENKNKLLIKFNCLIEKILVQNSDHIIVTYEKIKKYYHETYGYDIKNITVLGNPIDTNLFMKYKIDTNRDLVSIVRFTEQKNLKNLIEAVAILNLSLTLIGKGELEDELKELVSSLNADVEFLKNIPNNEIPKLLASHKVFVLPSHFEGNPKVLLEAMSSEMICLASDIEEHTTIIDDGKNGFICGTNVKNIQDKLELVFNNLDKFSDIGKYARETILDRYSMDKNSDREVEIYKMLLGENE